MARRQQIADLVSSRHSPDQAAGHLISLLPALALAEMPLLTLAAGNRPLSDALVARGLPLKARLHPHPDLPGLRAPYMNSRQKDMEEQEGIDFAQVVVRRDNPAVAKAGILQARPDLLPQDPKQRKQSLNRGLVECMTSNGYNWGTGNAQEGVLENCLTMVRVFMNMGADLSTPKASREAARAAGTLIPGLVLRECNGEPGRLPMALELMELLAKAGCDRKDLAACVHAKLIVRPLKRYTNKSDLPPSNQALIRAGWPIAGTAVMEKGDSPLASMLQVGLVKGVEQMIAHGEDLEWQCSRTGTTLPMLASHGKTSTLKAMDLIPDGSFRRIINFQDSRGETALHMAVCQSSAPMVKRWLQEGADATIQDHRGRTPLQLLPLLRGHKAQANFDAIIEAFEEHGISTRAQDDDSFPLHAACRSLSLPGVKKLLGEGADMMAQDRAGLTAIDMLIDKQPSLQSAAQIRAAGKKQMAIIQALVEHGLPLDSLHEKGKTMLRMAADTKRWGLVLSLLRAGADPGVLDDQGSGFLVSLAKKEGWATGDYLVRNQERELGQVLQHLAQTGWPMGEPGDLDPLAGLADHPQMAQVMETLRMEQALEAGTAQATPACKRGPRRL